MIRRPGNVRLRTPHFKMIRSKLIQAILQLPCQWPEWREICQLADIMEKCNVFPDGPALSPMKFFRKNRTMSENSGSQERSSDLGILSRRRYDFHFRQHSFQIGKALRDYLDYKPSKKRSFEKDKRATVPSVWKR